MSKRKTKKKTGGLAGGLTRLKRALSDEDDAAIKEALLGAIEACESGGDLKNLFDSPM